MATTVPPDPLVIAALDAIDEACSFVVIDRITAMGFLNTWPKAGDLTEAQRAEVLSRYELLPPFDGHDPSPGGGWISGPCIGGAEE